jgi:hypothetical protein
VSGNKSTYHVCIQYTNEKQQDTFTHHVIIGGCVAVKATSLHMLCVAFVFAIVEFGVISTNNQGILALNRVQIHETVENQDTIMDMKCFDLSIIGLLIAAADADLSQKQSGILIIPKSIGVDQALLGKYLKVTQSLCRICVELRQHLIWVFAKGNWS